MENFDRDTQIKNVNRKNKLKMYIISLKKGVDIKCKFELVNRPLQVGAILSSVTIQTRSIQHLRTTPTSEQPIFDRHEANLIKTGFTFF